MATASSVELGPLGLENPMGTDGFEFVEYAAPDPELLRALFAKMGFPAVARHKRKNVTLHRQGDINFIINAEPGSFAEQFRARAWPLRLRHGVPGQGCQIRARPGDEPGRDRRAERCRPEASSTSRRSRVSAARSSTSSTAMATKARSTTSTSISSRMRPRRRRAMLRTSPTSTT